LSRKTIAVIFARGAGDAVPFLNARNVAGKPLLHYTISAAKKAKKISAVYVSTEDERIASVAAAAGARVLMRPANLSGHRTPLETAVADAAGRLHKEHGKKLGHLACLQADAIFCSSDLIDRAVAAALPGRHDRIIGLLPEFKKFVIWKQKKGRKRFNLVVPPPHMRPKDETHYREAGVITVWKTSGGKIRPSSLKMGFVTLGEEESFRVDTEHDLKVAESMLGPQRLALRCDGSPSMGMGHIMRLLYIAQHLNTGKGSWVVRFFVGSEHIDGARILTERGQDVDIVESNDVAHWLKRIGEFTPQIIINDLRFVPAEYSDVLCDLPCKIITLVDSVADIDPKTKRLDTVISYMDEPLHLPHNSYHAGPNFAPLHPSIVRQLNKARNRKFKPGPLRFVLSFGATDPMGLTYRTMEALAETQSSIRSLTAVVHKSHQNEKFWKLVSRFRKKPKIFTSPGIDLGGLLRQADVAIVSGGTTAYEASALGVPSIVLCQNDREHKRMQIFERSSCILLLGLGKNVSAAQIARIVSRLSQDPDLRRRLSKAGLETSDGHGTERISKLIQESLGEKLA